MKILFFGLGSIGKRHMNILKKDSDHEIYAYSKSNHRVEGVTYVNSLDNLETYNFDFAIISNPTSEHVKYATICAESKINLFIEKPLSHTLDNVDKLISLCNDNEIHLYVAYNMRFHPIIDWIKNNIKETDVQHVSITASSYLPHWRPAANHRLSYSSHKHMGGGVILDLSHEIDYARYLFGESTILAAISDRTGSVTVDSEDTADIILKTKYCYINMHLDYTSFIKKRFITIQTPQCTVHADLIKETIDIQTESAHKTIKFEKGMEQSYKQQMATYITNIKEGKVSDYSETVDVFKQIISIRDGAL